MTDQIITSKRQLPENYTVIPLAELLPEEKGLTRDTVCVLHSFIKDKDHGRRPQYWLLRSELKQGDERRAQHASTMMKLIKHFGREKFNYQLCETPADIIDFLRQQERERASTAIGDEQTDIETYINELIGYAIDHKTADVHITRFENHSDVEMRINRRLQHVSQITTRRADELVNCLYTTKAVNAQGDINLRIPQDADITLKIDNETIRLRYSHAPIHPRGWHCSLRLLSGVDVEVGDFKESLVSLGYYPHQAEAMFRIFKRRYGAFLIAGETGSGKSTTLMVALGNWYNYKEGSINILTAEDPPEYVIHGAKQTPVNKSGKGLAEGDDPFMSVFRSMMRRDGDILMPGEIREASSVNAFAEATLSGHKVVASIHASSAMGIIPRLFNIGTKCRENPVDRNTLSNPNFLSGFAYQQLVPLNCPSCSLTLSEGRKKGLVEDDCFERLCAVVDKKHHKNIRVRNHDGCEACRGTGLKGVITCAEVAEVDSTIREHIGNCKDLEADRYWRGLATKLEPQGWADARYNKQGVCVMDVAITRVIMGELDPMEAENACDIFYSPRPEKQIAEVVSLHRHKSPSKAPAIVDAPPPVEPDGIAEYQDLAIDTDEPRGAAESVEVVALPVHDQPIEAVDAKEDSGPETDEEAPEEVAAEKEGAEGTDLEPEEPQIDDPSLEVVVATPEESPAAEEEPVIEACSPVDSQPKEADEEPESEQAEEDEEPAAHLALLNELVDEEYNFDGLPADDNDSDEGIEKAGGIDSESLAKTEAATTGKEPVQIGSSSMNLISGYSYSPQVGFGQSWPAVTPTPVSTSAESLPVKSAPSADLLRALESIDTGVESMAGSQDG